MRKINQWYDEWHFICLFTARTEDRKRDTLAWLEKNGVKHHQLILGNPIRATRYKGVFGDMVKRTKDVMVFEDE